MNVQASRAWGEAVDDGGAELVARARAGDRKAFDRLVERYGTLVCGWAALHVGQQDATDAAQEVWLTVSRKLRQLEEDAHFVGWLRTLTFYQCLNYRKVRARRARGEVYLDAEGWLALTECVAGGGDGLTEATEHRELRALVSAALDRLPGDYGLILRLRWLRGLSYKEIAAIARLPPPTVKWRMHEGRQLLRALLAAIWTSRGRTPR